MKDFKQLLLLPLIFIAFIFITLFYPKLVIAQEDNFNILEKVKIGDNISQVSINPIEIQEGDGFIAYAYSSSNPSISHIIHQKENIITFIQLTIPDSKQIDYATQLESLGEAERTMGKTKSEILLSFYSKGIAYAVNGYSGQVIYVMKFAPKSEAQFVENEGRNYEPVERTKENTKLIVKESDQKETNNILNSKNKNLIILAIILIFLIVLLVFLKKHKRSNIEN